MGNVTINTAMVEQCASQLKTINNQINNNMRGMRNKMQQLNNSWDGSASEKAISRFNEIINKSSENRYKVMDNYVNYLYQQIGAGYVQTEEANKKLADAFK